MVTDSGRALGAVQVLVILVGGLGMLLGVLGAFAGGVGWLVTEAWPGPSAVEFGKLRGECDGGTGIYVDTDTGEPLICESKDYLRQSEPPPQHAGRALSLAEELAPLDYDDEQRVRAVLEEDSFKAGYPPADVVRWGHIAGVVFLAGIGAVATGGLFLGIGWLIDRRSGA